MVSERGVLPFPHRAVQHSMASAVGQRVEASAKALIDVVNSVEGCPVCQQRLGIFVCCMVQGRGKAWQTRREEEREREREERERGEERAPAPAKRNTMQVMCAGQ